MFFVFRGKKSGFFAILYWVGGYNNCKGKVVELSRPPPQNCRNALNTSWAGGPGLEQPWTPARGRPVTLIISSVLTPPQNSILRFPKTPIFRQIWWIWTEIRSNFGFLETPKKRQFLMFFGVFGKHEFSCFFQFFLFFLKKII